MCRFCGTPSYLAPEMLRRTDYSKDVDWWSLGILLFELVVGVVPFFDANERTMYRRIMEAPLAFPSYVRGMAREFIEQLLAKDPRHRLGHAQDIREVRRHAWFADMDWMALEKKEVEPPYKPGMATEGNSDTDDAVFTDYDDYGCAESQLASPRASHLDKGLLVNYAV